MSAEFFLSKMNHVVIFGYDVVKKRIDVVKNELDVVKKPSDVVIIKIFIHYPYTVPFHFLQF